MKKVTVIGSGVMGRAIAALIANSGRNVILLDVPSTQGDRNAISQQALENMQKNKLLYVPESVSLITIGNIENDLDKIRHSDLIIEVVAENIDIKHALYKKIERQISTKTILASNTSTFTLKELSSNMDPGLKSRFFITHFFNPPKMMPLLEFIAPENADAEDISNLTKFFVDDIGRTLVECRDTPGFIANRIGCAWLAIFLTETGNMSFSQVDAEVAEVMLVPKTGIFGLLDLIGLDTFSMIMQSLKKSLSKSDLLFSMSSPSPLLEILLKNKWLGRKSDSGFYKKTDELLQINYDGRYVAIAHDATTDKTKKAVHIATIKTLLYACYVAPEIASNASMIDSAMRSGYSWNYGPFELIDRMGGASWLIKEAEQLNLPIPAFAACCDGKFYNDESCLADNGSYVSLSEDAIRYDIDFFIKKKTIIMSNESAALFNLDDGIVCFVIINKNKLIDLHLLELLDKSINYAIINKLRGVVIYGGYDNFCRGADIKIFAQGNRQIIRELIIYGTQVFAKLKLVPTVAAVAGYAIGGGCELMMHCYRSVVHCNARIGLVESNIGLIPGWGGCREMLYRVSKANIAITLDQLLEAKVSGSAQEARTMLYLTDRDVIVMNQQKLLRYAIDQIIAIKNYTPRKSAGLLRGINGYIDILEKHRNKNKYDQPMDNIARNIIELYRHSDDFEGKQVDIFIDLVLSKHSQDKISKIINTKSHS